MHKDTWLSHLEEQVIKAKLHKLIETTDTIEPKIIPYLEAINAIDGIATLQSFKHNTDHYLTIRSNAEMCFFLEESIWFTADTEKSFNIEWDHFILYNVCGKQKTLSCILLKSDSWSFLPTLLEYFN